MLVISRKVKQSIVIADCDGVSCFVKVTIAEIRGDYVRLAFEAEMDVPIHRFEAWQRLIEDDDCADGDSSSGDCIAEIAANDAKNRHHLRPGDFVRIATGTFAGVKGTVARSEAHRVIVQLALLQKGVTIEVDDQKLELLGQQNGTVPPNDSSGD